MKKETGLAFMKSFTRFSAGAKQQYFPCLEDEVPICIS